MRHLIIGTAGHVDHGKTSLIRALTGQETDRLAEEKRRGLSIELGFAYFDLPNGGRAGIVDVPGHERFIDTMASGAYGMDLVLFVVSAKEGAQPQTIEHLQILDLLGVRHGILVVTMRDLVTAEELDFAIEETRELLQGTSLEGIPHVAVSSTTGEGIEDLRRMLGQVAERVSSEPASSDGIPRLPIDRVFTLEGFGVIVTGTLRGGAIEAEQRVIVMPQGLSARVRTVQVHNESVQRADAGQRTALNLVGVERGELNRGDIVTLPELDRTTDNLDVALRVVEDYPRIVEHWTRARLHIGTREAFCRIVLLVDEEGILPGGDSVVQLRMEEPMLTVRGDRFLLRDDSVSHTLGGGVVLDPIAPRHRRFSDETARTIEALRTADDRALLEHLLTRSENPFVAEDALVPYFPLRAGARDRWLASLERDGVLRRMEGRLILEARRSALMRAIRDELARHHEAEPLALGEGLGELRAAIGIRSEEPALERLLDEMVAAGLLAREGNLVRLAGHEVAFRGDDATIRDALERQFLDAGLMTPSPTSLREAFPSVAPSKVTAVLQALVQLGTFVKIDDEYWVHRDVYEEALTRLRRHFREHAELSLADFREMTGATRKYAVPFLEHCDVRGWTTRDGNVRRARRAFLDEDGGS